MIHAYRLKLDIQSTAKVDKENTGDTYWLLYSLQQECIENSYNLLQQSTTTLEFNVKNNTVYNLSFG